jgi:hypothetical protein
MLEVPTDVLAPLAYVSRVPVIGGLLVGALLGVLWVVQRDARPLS